MNILDFISILFSSSFLRLGILSAAPVALFLFVINIFPDEKQAQAKKRLGVVEESTQPQKTALLRWLRPAYSAVTPLLYSSMVPQSVLKYMDRRKPFVDRLLVAAALRDEITPDEFFGFKVVMSFVSLFLGVYVMSGMGNPPTPMGIVTLLILGFFFPDLWVREKKAFRKRQITKALPFAMDLVTLSVEAGLDFIGAISRLVQKTHSNEFTRELEDVLREIRLGTSRADALRNMSNRLQIEEITSLTTLLIQADQLGAPIGNVLRAQSEQLRSRRFQLAEVAGARASQLILFPLIFCILPAAIIILLGPTLLNFIAGGLY